MSNPNEPIHDDEVMEPLPPPHRENTSENIAGGQNNNSKARRSPVKKQSSGTNSGSASPPEGASLLTSPNTKTGGNCHPPNYDRHQQTHSTIAELSEAFRMFTNINGIVPQSVITPADLERIMTQSGMRTTDKDVAAYIQAIDQNQIGNISFDEFASLLGRSVPMPEIDGLQVAFWGVDKERKGWVTSGQFCELMASKGEMSSPDEVSEMLQFADPNNTGKVHYQVFLRMLGLRLR